ncbi:MAG TPA: site-specific integrase, partial [Baekduia sp.]|nr:site-specific integrase [Baekduia sp.]
GDGLAPATVDTTLNAVRALYRQALRRAHVAINPTVGLEMPRARAGRDRIATPAQAGTLLAALPDELRTLWACAMYAGLRRGEVLALRWQDVDLDAGVLHVLRSWDDEHKAFGAPKSASSVRKVPIVRELRRLLVAHRLASGGGELVFPSPREPGRPISPDTVRQLTAKAWRAAGLDGLTLHEARHTYASVCIAAGVNAKALSVYMGHSSVAITFDRYGHLMPGNEAEAVALVDGYLDAATC